MTHEEAVSCVKELGIEQAYTTALFMEAVSTRRGWQGWQDSWAMLDTTEEQRRNAFARALICCPDQSKLNESERKLMNGE